MKGSGPEDEEASAQERAFDEYVEAALAGRLEDPEAFCARRGIVSAPFMRRLEALLRLVLGDKDAATPSAPGSGEPGIPPFEAHPERLSGEGER